LNRGDALKQPILLTILLAVLGIWWTEGNQGNGGSRHGNKGALFSWLSYVGVVVFVRRFVRSTLTLSPGWSPASGGKKCDNNWSRLHCRTIPGDAVCDHPSFSFR